MQEVYNAKLSEIRARADSDNYEDVKTIYQELKDIALSNPDMIKDVLDTFDYCLSQEHTVSRQEDDYSYDVSSVDVSEAMKALRLINNVADDSVRHEIIDVADSLAYVDGSGSYTLVEIADMIIDNLAPSEEGGMYAGGFLSEDKDIVVHSMSVIKDMVHSSHCGAGTVECITNDLFNLSENPKFEDSALVIKEVSDTLDYIAKNAYDFSQAYYAKDIAENICTAVMEKHPELISSFNKEGYVGKRLTEALDGLTCQDMKRAKAEKDFGTPQDVTKAKERVMNHLKERHPSTKEETIKDKAKINHLKGNIKTSKLIGRNIAD